MEIQELDAPENYHVSVCSEDWESSIRILEIGDLINADTIEDIKD
jgi:hypothetical protein